MNHIAEDILMHIGMPRRSGRYPWGSGENPYQGEMDFVARTKQLQKEGVSQVDIAKALGFDSTTSFRTAYSTEVNRRRRDKYETARRMLQDGKTQAEAAREMGINESALRALIDQKSAARMNQAEVVANFLREQVDTRGMIDVGIGVEREIDTARGLGISQEKLRQALSILKDEGYEVYGGGIPQVTNPGKQTNQKVLCPPGTPHKDIYEHDKVHSLVDYEVRVKGDGTDVVEKSFVYPKSMDIKRLDIRYAEDGGAEKDGVIEIRRNVDDLSLGEARYSQVRILVDNDRYLKGMALYADDKEIPSGKDIVFNTNKTKDVPPREVMKPITADPDNPFGSLIKEHGGQSKYEDSNGERQLSLINKRADEGDWGEWSDSLPSQFLAKQPMSLINRQLGMSIEAKETELKDILALTNPTVKKNLLQSFADDCDSEAIHLQAAALPRQKHQVIMPLPSLKDTECYAPNYDNGDTVALIRYPHGGTFEIPVLTVNNKNKEGNSKLGPGALDVVGINAKVASRLSGADFDGDTVMVIPCNSDRSSVKITSTPPLQDLVGFDHKMSYPEYPGMKIMSNTQFQMGSISNLITDMTLKGAKPDELAKAVKHSMVVIDAKKHRLDYKKSEEENGIRALKKKYQGRVEDGKYREGASTLLSRAKGDLTIDKRVGSSSINQKGKEWYDPSVPEGALIWKTADNIEYTYTKVSPRTGKETLVTKNRTQRSTQMGEAKDAMSIASETRYPAEKAYGSFANKMKALANEARKEMVYTGNIKYNPSAAETYKEEVATLKAHLNIALKNAPRERAAQRVANSTVEAKKKANDDLTTKEIKKMGQQAISKYRAKLGAKRTPIPALTDRQWNAIQAGAISENTLTKILLNTDLDDVRIRATPRERKVLTPGRQSRIKNLRNSGYTTAQIAKQVGISPSTVSNYLKEEGVKIE